MQVIVGIVMAHLLFQVVAGIAVGQFWAAMACAVALPVFLLVGGAVSWVTVELWERVTRSGVV